MRRRRRRRAMRAALPLLLLLVLAAPLPATASPGAAAAVTAFSWEAPAETTGALAVRMTFDLGEANVCRFERQASGLHMNDAIHSWEEEGSFGGAFRSIYTAQAHATHGDLVVDTRTLRASNGDWSLTVTTEGPYAGVVPYTLVVFDAGSWTGAATGYQPPMRVDMRCDKPFTVGGFHKGREAVGFSSDHMAGGSGASANQLFGSATLVRGDAMAASFTHGVVTVRVDSEKWEGVTMGELTLATPAGASTHDLGAPIHVVHAGGPGAYGVSLDHLGVSLAERVGGVMYGLDPVQDLDTA